MRRTSALYLEGNNSYIFIPDVNNLNQIGTGDFTFEAWFKGRETEQPCHPQLMSNRPSEYGGGFLFGFHNQWRGSPHKLPYIQLGASNGLTKPQETPYLLDSKWHHFAVTRQGNTVFYYLDGIFYGSVTHTVMASSVEGRDLNLGRDQPVFNNTGFRGFLAEVRIWNILRTENEIQASMNISLTGREAGLIHYWPLSEQDGQIAHDLGMAESIGILRGSASWQLTDFPALFSPNVELSSSYYSELRARAIAVYERQLEEMRLREQAQQAEQEARLWTKQVIRSQCK
ncbi:LamG domain-containing protein [Roseofilum sp. Guam]|uniref:LamG domain-containing protein n=1 Tax=Roseofilum sp. Guam TaxID=2821502 RepID=UPI001B13B8E2|nr:LamG domain-containing protein [Roseofilum sp. Guam]MBP0030239.1 LamG domain-containing protein [Roseofilum sp. Guam]